MANFLSIYKAYQALYSILFTTLLVSGQPKLQHSNKNGVLGNKLTQKYGTRHDYRKSIEDIYKVVGSTRVGFPQHIGRLFCLPPQSVCLSVARHSI